MKSLKIIYITTLMFLSTIAFSQSQKSNKMSLNDLHQDSIGVQSKMLFPAISGKVISLRIQKNNQLEEHITTVPALLVCVSGQAEYQDEKGNKSTLSSGDFVKIEPNIKHWVNGIETSNLLLIK